VACSFTPTRKGSHEDANRHQCNRRCGDRRRLGRRIRTSSDNCPAAQATLCLYQDGNGTGQRVIISEGNGDVRGNLTDARFPDGQSVNDQASSALNNTFLFCARLFSDINEGGSSIDIRPLSAVDLSNTFNDLASSVFVLPGIC
jgi:Peptidase inhibitor family I36